MIAKSVRSTRGLVKKSLHVACLLHGWTENQLGVVRRAGFHNMLCPQSPESTEAIEAIGVLPICCVLRLARNGRKQDPSHLVTCLNLPPPASNLLSLPRQAYACRRSAEVFLVARRVAARSSKRKLPCCDRAPSRGVDCSALDDAATCTARAGLNDV